MKVAHADHWAAKGCVLRKDAGSFGFCPAACPAVGLGAVGAQHHPAAVVAGYTVPPG